MNLQVLLILVLDLALLIQIHQERMVTKVLEYAPLIAQVVQHHSKPLHLQPFIATTTDVAIEFTEVVVTMC